ncbi:PLP-dependent aminotransferase family protein [Nonomuraea sp. MCN248]|uniref:PLP-dependent aminotransferase family protein n=1 Tax=Nonomuraea corallina TaxID=2989783 RepID=A0ABT4SE67_9ACTN|nr:PLP-dependent aminotransferase family protein [Nonomuraea corallina]MDA0635497.1 PLP-dependent aminotransferase family protein [Nonomuraea corallina]
MNGANTDHLVDLLGRWASGRGPLYLLLAARLRALIDDGVLHPGEPLPPDRVLAGRLAVGRGTVVAAYELLQREGRVLRRQGSGTRVAELDLPGLRTSDGVTTNPLLLHILHPPDGAMLLTCAAPDEPPPELAEAYEEAAGRLAGMRDLGYQPAGQPDLCEAVAAYYRRRGLPTTAQEIIVTTGAQQALTLLAGLLVSPGDRVLTESPTYPGALEVFRQAAASVRPVLLDPLARPEESPADESSLGEPPLGESSLGESSLGGASLGGASLGESSLGGGLDAGSLLSAVPAPVASGRRLAPIDLVRAARERAALLYTVPTASNPTGTIMDVRTRRRVAALTAEHDLPVIDDEVCAELCFDGETPAPLAAYASGKQVITVASLSKMVWGGLRIGWIRAPAPLVARLARLRAVHDLGGDVVSQLAATALLRRLDEIKHARLPVLRARHDHLCAELRDRLPSWSFEPARGGQTIWVRLPRGEADSYAQVALRHGVAVPPGRSFDPLGGLADRMRLHFLFPEAELSAAVRALAAAWRAYDGVERPPSRPTLVV